MSEWLISGAKRDKQSVSDDWMPTGQRLIDGVRVREIRSVITGYGVLTEIYRSDWRLDDGTVGQAFQAVLNPGAISAWHAHEATTDRLFVSCGLIHIVLFDARTDSPTHGLINHFRFGTARPAVVSVPPRVWHGIRSLSSEPSTLINIVDVPYNYADPDHWRVPFDSPDIPYRFSTPD